MSVKVLSVGVGGYGATYVRPLLDNIDNGKYEYVGIVDVSVDRCPYIDEIKEKNIPTYSSMEDFFAENTADLVVISTPPHFHAQHCIYAVEHGANVLCEKPIAPSYEDAMAICEASERTGKFIGIGYQLSYNSSIINLKKDVLNGTLGKPIELKTIILWPRDWVYYNRTSKWAGMIKDDAGNLILDSVISNATAHDLHNMFFVLGDTMQTSRLPKNCTAELFRANKIQNFDTAVLKMETDDGVKLMMVSAHSINEWLHPTFEFKFENAVVTFTRGDHVIATFNDGTTKDYGDPMDPAESVKKLWDAIDAVESGTELSCVAKTAVAHNVVINSLYENCPIQSFPEELVVNDDEDKRTYVIGLADILRKAYSEFKMLSEINVEWAKSTEFEIDKKYL